MSSKILQVRDFYVVGGGCFGTQYSRWLLQARRRGMVTFERLLIMDHDPACRLRSELSDPDLHYVQTDWIEYLTHYLLQHYRDIQPTQDQWLPSPLSPHLLFLAFQAAAKVILKSLEFAELIFQENVQVPVQIPLQNGNLAVSFAEWQCPVNCIEPKRCPAIAGPRTWDMKKSLADYFLPYSQRISAHVLQCEHLVHGVGTISLENILMEFRQLLRVIKKTSADTFALATVSRCHGLIGAAHFKVATSLP